MYIRIDYTLQIKMRVSASDCVVCLNDDDDEDIVGLCEQGTYITTNGTEQHHGVCRTCLPMYIDRNPWDCLICRRPYGLRFMRESARMRGEPDDSLELLNEPSWASAPMVSFTDIYDAPASAFTHESSIYDTPNIVDIPVPSLYGNDDITARQQFGNWHSQPATSFVPGTTLNGAFQERGPSGISALDNLPNFRNDQVTAEPSENFTRGERRANMWLQTMAAVRRRRGERLN